jgi:hypothetical protein
MQRRQTSQGRMIGAKTERNLDDAVKVHQSLADELRRSLNHGVDAICPSVELTLRNRHVDFRSRVTDDEFGLLDIEKPGKKSGRGVV